jgi:hypothetical protein
MGVVVGWIVSGILNWLEKFFEDHLAAYEQHKSDQAKQEAQAAQDTEKASKLNPDSSGGDVSSAIDDELKHL